MIFVIFSSSFCDSRREGNEFRLNKNTISAEYSKKPQVTDWKEELQDCLHLNGVDVTVRILERSFCNCETNFFSQYSKAENMWPAPLDLIKCGKRCGEDEFFDHVDVGHINRSNFSEIRKLCCMKILL